MSDPEWNFKKSEYPNPAPYLREMQALIARAQDIETAMDLKPCFILPAHVAPGCTIYYGYRIIRADVPHGMVAVSP